MIERCRAGSGCRTGARCRIRSGQARLTKALAQSRHRFVVRVLVGSNVCSRRWMGRLMRRSSVVVRRRRCELVSIFAQQARLEQRVTQLVREADDDGDWRAAGCSSSAQWFAQVSSSDHRTAVRITKTSVALRSLPALDHAMSTGALTLDQVAAAAEFATPESDAELARVAVGKPPSAIGLVARTLAPPVVEDDQALYARRASEHDVDAWAARAVSERPAAARAGRRLRAGDLGHRQGAARGSTSRQAASSTGSSRPPTRSSHSPSTAAASGGVRRSATTLIVHLSDDAAAVHRGRRAAQPRDRRTARLRRTAPHDQAEAGAISCTRVSGAARPTRSYAPCTSAQAIASTRAAPPRASSKHTTSSRTRTAARPSSPT